MNTNMCAPFICIQLTGLAPILPQEDQPCICGKRDFVTNYLITVAVGHDLILGAVVAVMVSDGRVWIELVVAIAEAGVATTAAENKNEAEAEAGVATGEEKGLQVASGDIVIDRDQGQCRPMNLIEIETMNEWNLSTRTHFVA